MAELIQKQDTLNEGRVKINAAITDAEQAKVTAGEADVKATQALANSESTQTQLDTIVINGDSSVEAAQARVDEKGVGHTTLKDRIDDGFTKVTSQLNDTDNFRFYESTVSRKKPGMYASIVDDDGNKGVYTKLLPLAVEYGIPMTSALITSRLDGSNQMTAQERRECHDSGLIEFVSHTHNHDVNHRPNDMTVEELYTDFLASKKIMKELGYNYRGLSLPFGDRSEKVKSVARDCYDYVIGTGSGGPAGEGRVNYPGELDNQYLWRISLEYGIDYVKEKVNELHAKGVGWIIFICHVDQGDWYSESFMREVIEYVNSKNIEWVKTEDGINKIGNIAQFGGTKITATGEVTGTQLGSYEHQDTFGTSGENLATDFRLGKTTVSPVNLNNTQSLPLNESGLLYTTRGFQKLYNHQIFVTNRDKKIFMRYWVTDGEEKWSDWENVTPEVYLGVNKVTLDTNATNSLLRHRNTSTFIDSSGNSEFPESSSGWLKTYAKNGTDVYQEYKLYRKNKTFVRNWLGSSWGEFKLQSPIINTPTNRTLSLTLSAGETRNIVTDNANFKTGDILHVQPDGTVENGIIWTQPYVHEEGRCLFKLYNTTNSVVALSSRNWEINQINTR